MAHPSGYIVTLGWPSEMGQCHCIMCHFMYFRQCAPYQLACSYTPTPPNPEAVYCCTCLHPKFRFMLWSSSLLVIFAVSGSIISESYFLMSYVEHKINIIQPHLHIWHWYQLQSSNLNGCYPNRWEVLARCQAQEWILWCMFLLLVYEHIMICMRRQCLCHTRYFNQARSHNQTWTCAEWSCKIGAQVLCIQSAGWRIQHPSCLLVWLWNGF